jgi:hypothetical protein
MNSPILAIAPMKADGRSNNGADGRDDELTPQTLSLGAAASRN